MNTLSGCEAGRPSSRMTKNTTFHRRTSPTRWGKLVPTSSRGFESKRDVLHVCFLFTSLVLLNHFGIRAPILRLPNMSIDIINAGHLDPISLPVQRQKMHRRTTAPALPPACVACCDHTVRICFGDSMLWRIYNGNDYNQHGKISKRIACWCQYFCSHPRTKTASHPHLKLSKLSALPGWFQVANFNCYIESIYGTKNVTITIILMIYNHKS